MREQKVTEASRVPRRRKSKRVSMKNVNKENEVVNNSKVTRHGSLLDAQKLSNKSGGIQVLNEQSLNEQQHNVSLLNMQKKESLLVNRDEKS